MQARPNVFISATTADLGPYRLAVRDTLLDQGVHPILQNHFEPDYQTLLDILRRESDACDAVICLVRFVYGQEPQNRPEHTPRRSYTQLEFDIAEAFSKPIYVFLADAQCAFDPHPDEPPELCQLQQDYREHPHWQVALANYSSLLQAMGLAQDEIAQRLQDVTGHPASYSQPPD